MHVGAQMFQNLVERTDRVDGEGDIPRTTRRQQWSAFNVPLMWAAADSGRDAVFAGWDALHETMRAWSIQFRRLFRMDSLDFRNPVGEPISAAEHRRGS